MRNCKDKKTKLEDKVMKKIDSSMIYFVIFGAVCAFMAFIIKLVKRK